MLGTFCTNLSSVNLFFRQTPHVQLLLNRLCLTHTYAGRNTDTEKAFSAVIETTNFEAYRLLRSTFQSRGMYHGFIERFNRL